MLRIVFIVGVLLVGSGSYAQEHHCIGRDGSERRDIRFERHENDRVDEGHFDVRVTSGFTRLGNTRRFYYCLENLRGSSVQFKWDGPKPNKLLENKLGRPPSDGRTGKVKGHRDTIGLPTDDPILRTLHLRLSEYDSYEGFEVNTIIEAAEHGGPRVVPAQVVATLDLSSGQAFAEKLGELGEPLELSAGVVFDMPANDEEWNDFIEGGKEGEVDSARVRADVVLRYDPVTLDVSVSRYVGFAPAFSPPVPEVFFPALGVSFGEAGFAEFGFEDIASTNLPFEGELSSIGAGFIGVSQTIQLGSLGEFSQDERPLSRGDLPIVLLLNEAPVAQFYLEVIGTPPDL